MGNSIRRIKNRFDQQRPEKNSDSRFHINFSRQLQNVNNRQMKIQFLSEIKLYNFKLNIGQKPNLLRSMISIFEFFFAELVFVFRS